MAEKLIVIGGTAAGLSAASRARKEKPDMEIQVFEKSGFVSYGACGLPYFVGGLIHDINDLVAINAESLKNMRNISAWIHHEVLLIDPEKKEVSVKNLDTDQVSIHSYDKLVIATGAVPVVPPIPGIHSDGVYYLRNMEDGIRLKAAAREHGRVCIIGGGAIGLEAAEELRNAGLSVSVYEQFPRLLPFLDNAFSQALEELDPSEHYRGTPLEGLDAFQRQLKRFDIHVKGAGSDMVEKFFHTSDSAVLFPEFVSRVVRQGMEEESILPAITATVTKFDGMDYRSIASVPSEEDKKLRRVEEGARIPETTVRTQENLVHLYKRGRMLVASYEAIRFQRLDLFSVTLRQIGAYIGRMHLEDAIEVLRNGDGNQNAAQQYTIGTKPITGTKGTLTYDALLEFWSQFDPYTMNTMLVGSDVMLAMLKLDEFQNPLTGLNFQGTGTLTTPLGAKLLRTSAMPAGILIGLDRNYALEQICGSEITVEYDKLIDRQLERAAITSISGFAKLFTEASKVLVV